MNQVRIIFRRKRIKRVSFELFLHVHKLPHASQFFFGFSSPLINPIGRFFCGTQSLKGQHRIILFALAYKERAPHFIPPLSGMPKQFTQPFPSPFPAPQKSSAPDIAPR